jgi:hypothetical protein
VEGGGDRGERETEREGKQGMGGMNVCVCGWGRAEGGGCVRVCDGGSNGGDIHIS